MERAHRLLTWLLIAAFGAVLAGCRDGGASDAAGSTVNFAPTIGGIPGTTVAQGAMYSFTPTGADADGDALTFGIEAKPAWLIFDQTTGQLSGTPAGADVGVYRGIVVWVSDGKAQAMLPAFDLIVYGAPTTNGAPSISGTPPASVIAGSVFSFTPTASDPDGDPLTFSIGNRPAWASFRATDGRLTGTPLVANAGTFAAIVISVSDGTATASLPAFSILVTAPITNHAPTISGAPATTATQGTAYRFQPVATDADSDPLTFSIANRPTWLLFNGSTGLLQGTPGATNIGAFSNIVISVSDGRASTQLPAFSITVASSNTPPVISGTPPTTATVGTQYTFTPTASDANGDTLTFSITSRPSWASSFSTTTGRLRGTPATGDIGAFANIVITVSDGQDTAQLAAFTITVSAAPNRAPTISGTPGTAVLQGTAYTFTPTASDPDGNTLTYSITSMPAWASFSTSTGRLQGTPGPGDVGTTTGIVIRVSDGSLSASLPAFSLTVQAVAMGSATLTWIAPTENTDGSVLTNLAGFKIYWGTVVGTYPNTVTLNNPGLSTYVVESLVPATYFFAASAFNSTGVESALSATVSKTIQ